MKKNLLFTSLFLLNLLLFAQVTPSPDAMSTITGSTEDLYRGYVTESVPIYSLVAENGFSVPVSLQYQTRGIRVAEVASSVGLGWNLSAGGAITRVMRGQPDDQATFSAPDYTTVNWNSIEGNDGYDFEKDIFYYSFPGGGGKFISVDPIMTGSSEFYGLPYTDNKIEFNPNGFNQSSWVITDVTGVKYIFGSTEDAREITHAYSNEEGETPKDNQNHTYISTWYLEEIVFPNLPSESNIKFTYEKNENEIETISESKVRTYDLIHDATYWYYSREDGYPYFSLLKKVPGEYTTDFTIVPYEIPMGGNVPKRIVGPTGGSITGLFDYRRGRDRCDLDEGGCTQPLDPVEKPYLMDNINAAAPAHYENDIEVYIIDNDVFETKTNISTSITTASHLVRIESLKGEVKFNTSNRQDIAGMQKVSSIEVKDHMNRVVEDFSLEYDYFDARDKHTTCDSDINCLRLKLISIRKNDYLYRSFQYMNEMDPNLELPGRSSKKIDRYGFFNNLVYSEFSRLDFRVYGDRNHPMYDAAVNFQSAGPSGNIRSSSTDVRANMLWKINYPVGGSKEFTFTNKTGGGTAVSSVILKDENNQIRSHRSYSYLNPVRFSSKMHAIGDLKVILFSDSPYLTFDHMNVAGYKNVTVKDEITKNYSEYSFHPGPTSDWSTKSKYELNHTADTWREVEAPDELEDKMGDDIAPIMAAPFSAFTGLPYLIRNLDREDNVISEVHNVYQNGGTSATIQEFAFLPTAEDENQFFVGEASLKLRPLYLSSTLSMAKEDDSEVWTKTTFQNHSLYRTLISETETIVTDSEGNPILDRDVINSKKTIYYPADQVAMLSFYGNESDILNRLLMKHMISVPLASVNQVDLPHDDYDGYWTNSVAFSKYDEYVVDAETTFMVPHTKHQYIITHPEDEWYNAFSSEIVETVTYNDKGLLATSVGQDAIVTSYSYNDQGYTTSMTTDPGIDNLKRTTTYEYYPLIGLKSVTGANGRKVSYRYDDQNRLLLTRDNENNIIKRYRYNTLSESQQGLSVYIRGENGYNLVGSPITLAAYLSGSTYGSPQYDWTGSPTGQFATYTFENAGSYNILLVVTDPEHPELETSASYPIEVFASKADLTIGGPSTVKYCHDGGVDGGLEGADGGSGETGAFYSGSSLFSFGFSTGARCYEGYEIQKYEYSNNDGATWTTFGESGAGIAELPLSAFEPYPLTSYDIKVKVSVKDLCNNETLTSTKSITVYKCNNGSGGDPDDGNGDTGWSLQMTPATSELCSQGDPSAVNVAAVTGELPACSSGFTFAWEYKGVGVTDWTIYPVLRDDLNSIVMDRDFLTSPETPFGAWDVKVTVSDGCGTTKTATARVSILSTCNGDEGIEGADTGGGTGETGDTGDTGDGETGGGGIEPPGGGGI